MLIMKSMHLFYFTAIKMKMGATLTPPLQSDVQSKVCLCVWCVSVLGRCHFYYIVATRT